MPWHSRLLRGERVFARVDEKGALAATPDGRVDVLYKPGGKVYRAAVGNLQPDPQPTVIDPPAAASAPSPNGRGGGGGGPLPAAAFVIYTDGACLGNPGPAGIGVVLLDGSRREEISEYIGEGTNNIAELTAILRGLERAPRDRPVLVHSDSSYSLGLLGKGWKAKANQELVARLRMLASEFGDLRLVKVPAHSGVVENERADVLANTAAQRRR